MEETLDARLLRTDRNMVLRLIEAASLDGSQFKWSETTFKEGIYGGTCLGSLLTHLPSEFFYAFGHTFDQYSPGRQNRIESISLSDRYSPKKQIRYQTVSEWAQRLKVEVDAPDLWTELLTTKALSTNTALMTSEHVFTDNEISYFGKQVEHIEKTITKTHQLTTAQIEAIHDGLDEMKREMNRFGKKDWVNVATGLLVNIMVGAALAPSAAKDLYNMFAAAVAPLLTLAHKLIQ